jgi:hypothetical protein
MTREIQAKPRYNFGKGQGLAREREKKRVTPEFGERKEEKKFYPQIQGVTVACKEVLGLILLRWRSDGGFLQVFFP